MLRIGKDETAYCIQEVALKQDGHQLCLAHKTTTYWFVAGVYLRDDGYVLKAPTTNAVYPMPKGEVLAQHQASLLLPDPLPAYTIPLADYVVGFSLWFVLAFVVAWSGLELQVRWRRRQRKDAAPPSHGPPQRATEMDRWLTAELTEQLGGGEVLQHQAYVVGNSGAGFLPQLEAPAFYVGLTNKSLILIATQHGNTRLSRENHGVTVIPRDSITGVVVEDDGSILVRTREGVCEPFFVVSSRQLSNQAVFRSCVPRLLADGISEKESEPPLVDSSPGLAQS